MLPLFDRIAALRDLVSRMSQGDMAPSAQQMRADAAVINQTIQDIIEREKSLLALRAALNVATSIAKDA